jgi:signal peptidase
MDEQEDSGLTADEEVEATDVSSPDEEEVQESEEEPTKAPWFTGRLRTLMFILRDVGIALLVVLLVFVVLWAYSGVWPPIVVVESGSMQHDDFTSSVGVIDTGDLVIVQKTNSHKEIEPYVHGKCSGESTYGDGGDKPIIHRALVWLEFNQTNKNSFDVPGLDCDYWVRDVNWWGWNNSGLVSEPRNITDNLILQLTAAYRNRTVTLGLSSLLDTIKADPEWTDGGFIAMGDHNPNQDTPLIKHERIIGKARGELPWFGLIKLSVGGDIPWGKVCSTASDDGCAPDNSWSSLIIALVVLIAVPIGLDIGLGFYQRWKKKKESEEETGEEEEEEPSEEEEEESDDEESEEETIEEETEDSENSLQTE